MGSGCSEDWLPMGVINQPDEWRQLSKKDKKTLILQHYLELYAHEVVDLSNRRRRSSASSTTSDASSTSLERNTSLHPNHTTPAHLDSMSFSIEARSKPVLRSAGIRFTSFTYSSTGSPTFTTSPIVSIPEDSILESSDSLSSSPSSVDDRDVFNAHGDLKCTLTALLNCETVRHDERMRAWVQTQLMDAEHELKRHRRRRVVRSSSASSSNSTSSSNQVNT